MAIFKEIPIEDITCINHYKMIRWIKEETNFVIT